MEGEGRGPKEERKGRQKSKQRRKRLSKVVESLLPDTGIRGFDSHCFAAVAAVVDVAVVAGVAVDAAGVVDYSIQNSD